MTDQTKKRKRQETLPTQSTPLGTDVLTNPNASEKLSASELERQQQAAKRQKEQEQATRLRFMDQDLQAFIDEMEGHKVDEHAPSSRDILYDNAVSDYDEVSDEYKRKEMQGKLRLFSHFVNMFATVVEGKESARGLTAQLLVVDEAAFVDRRLFTEGLFPILRMKNTALLCLSSPGDESNHYSRMVHAVDKTTQKPIFKYIQAKQICDECLKLPNEEAINCEHIKNTAPWINHRRSKKFQALYDDPVLAMAEYGGVIRSSHMSAFRKSEILKLFDENQTPYVRTTATPSMIFITADNNGGGSSHMGLCSGYYAIDGTFVVCGLESEPVKNEIHEKELLERHVAAINSISAYYRAAPKIFIPEVNYGMPDHLANMVQDMENVFVFHDPKHNKPGVYKTKESSEHYRFYTSNALYHGTIRFDEDVFTVSKGIDDSVPIEKMMHTLQNQLERYHYVTKEPIDVFGQQKKRLTGKTGGENDDLLIVFMMCITWGRVCLKDPRVREAVRQRSVGGRYLDVGYGVNSLQSRLAR